MKEVAVEYLELLAQRNSALLESRRALLAKTLALKQNPDFATDLDLVIPTLVREERLRLVIKYREEREKFLEEGIREAREPYLEPIAPAISSNGHEKTPKLNFGFGLAEQYTLTTTLIRADEDLLKAAGVRLTDTDRSNLEEIQWLAKDLDPSLKTRKDFDWEDLQRKLTGFIRDKRGVFLANSGNWYAQTILLVLADIDSERRLNQFIKIGKSLSTVDDSP